MDVDRADCSGLALGAWGAVQATAAGIGIALGGVPARRRRWTQRQWRARAGAGRTGDRLHVRLPRRGRAAVLGHGRDRTTGPDCRVGRAAVVPPVRSRGVSRLVVSSAEVSVMQTGAITSYVDVAQLVLYAFWIFFAGLVLIHPSRGQARRLPARIRALEAHLGAGLPVDTEAEDVPHAARRLRAEAGLRSRCPSGPRAAERTVAGRAAGADRQPDAGCSRPRAHTRRARTRPT